jgi:hypothetical protein
VVWPHHDLQCPKPNPEMSANTGNQTLESANAGNQTLENAAAANYRNINLENVTDVLDMPTHPNPRDDPCHGQHAGPHVAPAPSGLTAPRTAMPETEPCISANAGSQNPGKCKCRKPNPGKCSCCKLPKYIKCHWNTNTEKSRCCKLPNP